MATKTRRERESPKAAQSENRNFPRIRTWEDLKSAVEKEGFDKPKPARALAELSLHVLATIFGIIWFVQAESMLWQAMALFVSTVGMVGVGTSSHTSSHFATCSKDWQNKFLLYFGFPFFLQISAAHWRFKHVVQHHCAPNIVGLDSDVDLSPVFALTNDQVEASSGFLRRWYALQWLAFPLTLPFNGFNLIIAGWRFLISEFRGAKGRREEIYLDLACLLLHWLVWIILPMLWFEPLSVVGFYILRFSIAGIAMFVVLAPAHFPEEAQAANKNALDDPVLVQTSNTINFSAGTWWRIFLSGADYQIEHHLFPAVSHVHFRRMSGFVQEFCESNGYPYRTLKWPVSVWRSFTIMHHPKIVYDSLESFRNPPLAANPCGSKRLH